MSEPFSYRRSKLERVYFGKLANESLKKELGLIASRRILVMTSGSLIREQAILREVCSGIPVDVIDEPAAIGAHSPGTDIIEAVKSGKKKQG